MKQKNREEAEEGFASIFLPLGDFAVMFFFK
jgi:hypothetical protein